MSLTASISAGGRGTLEEWNNGYRWRARKTPRFLVCAPDEHMNLFTPPIITTGLMLSIFGRVLGTRNPPAIKEEQLAALRAIQSA